MAANQSNQSESQDHSAVEMGQDVVVTETPYVEETSPRTRAATTSSVKRAPSSSNVVRVAGRGRAPVPVRVNRSPRETTSTPASVASSERTSLVDVRTSGELSSRPSIDYSASINKRNSGVSTPPMTPEMSRPPRPNMTPPPAVPSLDIKQSKDRQVAANDNSSLESSNNNMNNSSGGGGWGFLGSVSSTLTSIWSADKAKDPPPKDGRGNPPPSSPKSIPPPPQHSSPPPPPSSSSSSHSHAPPLVRDSLTQLEEMMELQESVDALRMIVAKQGTQIRQHEATINMLVEKLAYLEQKLDPSAGYE